MASHNLTTISVDVPTKMMIDDLHKLTQSPRGKIIGDAVFYYLEKIKMQNVDGEIGTLLFPIPLIKKRAEEFTRMHDGERCGE